MSIDWITEAAVQIEDEVTRAIEKHPECPSVHHAHSVIREEYLELEKEVLTDGIDHNEEIRARAKKEAIHLAATCIRMIGVLDKRNGSPRF